MSVSSLQSALDRVQEENRRLRAELSELEAGSAAAASEMDRYLNHVDQSLNNSRSRIEQSHQNTLRAYEIQMEIDRLYLRFKEMETANKRIRELNNKKYYDFQNYSTIRKIMQGILDNLSLAMVSDDVIYKSVEKKHLTTPTYWLTTVLIALMAWRNDDKALADRAVGKSLEIDRKNSIVFFMLFNLRMRRGAAALKWFAEYRNCALTGEDDRTFLALFSLLSDTVDKEADDHLKAEIRAFLNEVIDRTMRSEGYSEQDLVDRIEKYFARMAQSEYLAYDTMKSCLQDFDELSRITMLAKNQATILQFILDVGNVSGEERNLFLSRFIEEEVQKPNAEELAVYDEIEYNELIISQNGDLDEARRIFAERKKHRENELNLLSEMADWIYDRRNADDVSPQTKKNVFTMTLGLEKKAAAQYTAHYRARFTDSHPVNLGGDYQTTVNFGNRAAESQKIAEHFAEIRDQRLSEIKPTMIIVGALLAVAGVAGAIAAHFWALFALLLIGGVMVVYTIIHNSRQKKQIEADCALSVESKNHLMDQLFAEYANWRQMFLAADAYSERVNAALDQF